MRHANPLWKSVLAILALVLTSLIWAQGLQESFSRPSVSPKISLNQNELALLAEPALPESFREVLVGLNPQSSLRDALRDIPLSKMDERNRILLAALEESDSARETALRDPFQDSSFRELQQIIKEKSLNSSSILNKLKDLNIKESDPVLFGSLCLLKQSSFSECVSIDTSRLFAFRLVLSQLIPAGSVLIGSILLVVNAWTLFRSRSIDWPKISSMPLSLVDMTLLVAGGFVVLGEVIFPTFFAPLIEQVTRGFKSPLDQSLKVLLGYILMTIPPLFIFRRQLDSLKDIEKPPNGWLQWLTIPLGNAFLKAASAWLMIMPIVLFISWFVTSLFGDQGGSNPLLELVLRSKDTLPLFLLVITTVVLAPLFEELIFRGTLLPVLTLKLGYVFGLIVSAFVFAIAHLSVGELAPLFTLGLGLGILRLSSGCLIPCVLMHAFWNGVTFINLLLLGG